MNKPVTGIFLLSTGLGLLIWSVNTSVDYLLLYRPTELSFREFYGHELIHGLVIMVCFTGVGLLCSKLKTKQKKTEEALRINEQILQSAQRIAHVGSWHFDIRKNVLTWSDEVYRIFGLNPDTFEATYEAFLNTVHPDDRDLVNTAYSEAIRNRVPYEVVHRIIRPGGEVRIVHEKSEDVRDEAGNALHSIGMVHDITELKKTEAEKEKLISQLQKTLSEVKTLRGIIPICSFCKKIRDDQGYWDQVEVYVGQHTEADFSHGVCPDCLEKHYPEMIRSGK